MYEKKQLAKKAIAPLAGAYVGYIVLNNLNLQINTVGFYQISKIAVAPAGKLCTIQMNSLLVSLGCLLRVSGLQNGQHA